MEGAADTLLDEEEVAPSPPPPLWVGRPLDWPEARALAAHLAVLADASRLRLLSRIASEVDGRASVGDLARFLELRQPTTTHHLQALHRAGFVARIPDDRRVYYRLEASTLERIGEILRPPETLPGASENAAHSEALVTDAVDSATAATAASSTTATRESAAEPPPADLADALAGRSER